MSAEDKVNSEFIASVYGKPVIIGLFTGVIYKGIRFVLLVDIFRNFGKFRWLSERSFGTG